MAAEGHAIACHIPLAELRRVEPVITVRREEEAASHEATRLSAPGADGATAARRDDLPRAGAHRARAQDE
jgi:hypothetical protein